MLLNIISLPIQELVTAINYLDIGECRQWNELSCKFPVEELIDFLF